MAQDRVEAVERALTILEAFDSAENCFTLAELANVTGFYKSTLLRLLGSLERFDYVQRGADGRYRLGLTPLRLARHLPGHRLEARIQSILGALATASGETASLIEVVNEVAECRLAAMPDHALRHELQPGQRWHAPDDAPTLSFSGGVMLCRRLSSLGNENLWLALSGPQGRLDHASAEKHLATALNALAHPCGGVTPASSPTS